MRPIYIHRPSEPRIQGPRTIKCHEGKHATPFTLSPRLTHDDCTHPQPHAITAFDVSPDGTQLATGYHDGTVHILPTAKFSSHSFQKARPHLSSVTSLRFFPSSRVLLSAGNDFTLTILPADPASTSDGHPQPMMKPARTLRAHTRAITATAIVERGKNVLSASKDASVRLWDVAGGSHIRTFSSTGYAPVLAMALGDRAELVLPVFEDHDADGGAQPAGRADNEVGTEGKLACCALGDGAFELFDLGSSRATCAYRSSSSGPALSAIAYSPRHSLLATGSAAGVVRLLDTRSLDTPLFEFTRGTVGVEDLAFVDLSGSSYAPNGGVGLAVATADGLPFVAGVRTGGDGASANVVAELVGPDCERVAGLRARGVGGWRDEGGAELWTAADDGVVRCY